MEVFYLFIFLSHCLYFVLIFFLENPNSLLELLPRLWEREVTCMRTEDTKTNASTKPHSSRPWQLTKTASPVLPLWVTDGSADEMGLVPILKIPHQFGIKNYLPAIFKVDLKYSPFFTKLYRVTQKNESHSISLDSMGHNWKKKDIQEHRQSEKWRWLGFRSLQLHIAF